MKRLPELGLVPTTNEALLNKLLAEEGATFSPAQYCRSLPSESRHSQCERASRRTQESTNELNNG